MFKKYKYTLIAALLSVAFVLGSMEATNLILWTRERQLLTENGKAAVETPVRAWQGDDAKDNPDFYEIGDFSTVTDWMTDVIIAGGIEDAINSWNNRSGVTVHNPVAGQISMTEAMAIADYWIEQMGFTEIQTDESLPYSTNATLGIPTQLVSAGKQSEPYYSFWTVQISSLSRQIRLYINAVTAQVCGAEITLYTDFPEKIPSEMLYHFVELSGFVPSDMRVVESVNGSQVIMGIDDNRICARMTFWRSQKDASLGGYENETDSGIIYVKGNVKITFYLSVDTHNDSSVYSSS